MLEVRSATTSLNPETADEDAAPGDCTLALVESALARHGGLCGQTHSRVADWAAAEHEALVGMLIL